MKLLLAFAAGVVLTSLAFVLWDRSAPTSFPEQVDGAAQLSPSFPSPVRDSPSSSETSAAADLLPEDRTSETTSICGDLPDDLTRFAMRNDRSFREAIDLLRSWSDEELRAVEERAEAIAACSQEVQVIEGAEKLAVVVGGELSRRENMASWDNAPPPDRPILLPPEFNRNLEIPIVRRDHENIQREAVDPTWALPMERNLRDFITGQSELLGKYGYPTITCRTSRCEVTFVAYGLDTAARAAEMGNPNMSPDIVWGRDFFDAAQVLKEEPWVVGQLNPNMFNPNITTHNGITTLIMPLYRDR